MSLVWQSLPFAPQADTLLCPANALIDGEAKLFDFGEGAQRFSLILLRSGNHFSAYLNRCPHFGVRLAEKQAHLISEPHRHIKSNVHYARFDWHNGECLWGECEGEGLLALPIHLDPQDGNVYLLSPPPSA